MGQPDDAVTLAAAMPRYCDGICPAFQVAVDVLAKPWTAQILYVLEERAPLRYAQLKARLGQISDRLLTERLKELQRLDIVTREVIDAYPVRVEYGLSATGRAFGPIVRALSVWGTELIEHHNGASQAADRRR